MAKKRNTSRKRQQSGGKSQTTVGTIVVAIVGLIFWWFTGSSPDSLINSSGTNSGDIGATPIVQEVAQTSGESDTPAEAVTEPDAPADSKGEELAADDETNVDGAAVDESTVDETDSAEPEPPAADTPVPDPIATDTPVPDPTATATTPPKPTNTAIPRPRGPPGLAEIHIDDLPPEARDTIDLIFSGGPYPFDRDGITFQNREGILPDHNRGYYEEYTVITPGLSHRGAKRIVIGRENEMYYTDDHYESFSWIAED